MLNSKPSLPIIDIRPLLNQAPGQQAVADQIGAACRTHGFFYIVGHGIDPGLQTQLATYSQEFFQLDLATKKKIRMELGGRAWRGYFSVGEELTSGQPDLKEGLYFGTERSLDDPKVKANWPLHGQNLFPKEVPELRRVVLAYMAALTQLGHQLMRGLALSLGLEPSFFQEHYTSDPLTLFRIFHYPGNEAKQKYNQWGVGEHTDYGVLTILKQDDIGGLEVKSRGEWIAAPPMPDSFVCNIGDMLDRMTGGRYRSTPHRVRNTSGKSRYSFPFFFDPNFDATIRPLPLEQADVPDDATERWDGASVHQFTGTYGDYLLRKVGKVFPDLQARTR